MSLWQRCQSISSCNLKGNKRRTEKWEVGKRNREKIVVRTGKTKLWWERWEKWHQMGGDILSSDLLASKVSIQVLATFLWCQLWTALRQKDTKMGNYPASYFTSECRLPPIFACLWALSNGSRYCFLCFVQSSQLLLWEDWSNMSYSVITKKRTLWSIPA